MDGSCLVKGQFEGFVILNAIDPAYFPGHVISEISNLSCDCVDLVRSKNLKFISSKLNNTQTPNCL